MRNGWLTVGLMVALAALPGCGQAEKPGAQQTFATAEDAVVALVDAARANDRAQLLAILGPDGETLLSSGDDVADQQTREVFLAAYLEQAHLTAEGDRTILNVGREEWPLPIPLVTDGTTWRFDTAAGLEEVLFRRIGRNELTAMNLCRTFVDAQKEYASKGRDGKSEGVYAQKFASDPGTHDGLYWPSDDPDDMSPLGELAAEAASEGYSASSGTPTPFHGYYFRILKGRGASAPGGAKDYVVGDEMRDGFALIAYPAAYQSSGVMTFMVDDTGTTYQKDLGPDTATLATAISVFDPDSSWEKAEPD
ncbi:MAG: DUF2950 domain-containing protein [Acidobacteriota bacterium]|nr:DUF2950 domain-containing protein [Acidobacteriota bacterium]